jgi:hypothetical protein
MVKYEQLKVITDKLLCSQGQGNTINSFIPKSLQSINKYKNGRLKEILRMRLTGICTYIYTQELEASEAITILIHR